MIREKPERWEELCHDIGLALLLGQKVQFAIAYYFGVHMIVRAGWDKAKADDKIRFFLSRPMGVVVSEIKAQTPLPDELEKRVDQFKKDRNWLVHDFDEEATPQISRGQGIDRYISRMKQIASDAQRIMLDLDKIGDDLMKEKGINPADIAKMVEGRINQ